ncbi:hypothetical protein [Erythrobacter sp. JK5]|uniref:hypothetical protein n=1 Tax=Erythrobacter sp. JK5 TaxID=2829500 RepID=UPI001BA7F327|nr:hypothetical protein [Erythrobacter sp. JK5]QUL38532.1 hypothetical protein KDC96_03800 [Erythrobacter sp. JK5]
MTRRTDNRTTRSLVPASEIPDFTPVPIKPRSDGWTPERQQEFIEALADTGSVEAACKHVNMSTVGAYRIRRLPEGKSFREAWNAALDLGVQRLEDVAMERALNGVEEPFYVYGQHVGTRKKYNDRLLMFMLRNRSPERFGNGVAKGGSDLKGLNAVGRMEKRRLKKKWRAQWETEQRAGKHNVSPAEVRASIERKMEGIRRQIEYERKREWEQLSEDTRAAWERFAELRDRDLDALKADEEMRWRLAVKPRS